MKIIKYLIIGITMFMTVNTFCQTSYLLTFKGEDTNTSANVTLDSVNIKNVTTGFDETITGTNYSLELALGITESDPNLMNAFTIFQNYPNPSKGLSMFEVVLPAAGELRIITYNLSGQELAAYSGYHKAGIHSFNFEGSGANLFMIVADNGKKKRSIKVLNANSVADNKSKINYIGSSNNSLNPVKKLRGTVTFTSGDQLMLTGYASGYYNDTIYDSPTGNKEYVFEFFNSPPSAPSNPNPSNNSVDQAGTTSLSWSPSTDPEGGPITYDIYLDTLDNPITVKSNHTTITYKPVTVLSSNTKYYWKVVAIDYMNNATPGIIWNFTTVDTNYAPSVPANPIPAHGSIDQPLISSISWSASIDPEGSPITYDIYFDESANPILVQSNYSGTTYNINTLDYDTKYYWKVVATDDKNNATSSSIWSFETGEKSGTFTDSRDNNTYYWVIIGNQTWMGENLAYLPSVSDPSNGSNTTAYYYVLDYNGTSVPAAKATSNYQQYGVFYNWPAAMNGAGSSTTNPSGVQGVCPTAWHLPSDNEWKELEMYLGMSQSEADKTGWRGTTEGGKLKRNSHWLPPNTGATNSSWFTAFPVGYRATYDSFYQFGYNANWWSTTERSASFAWSRTLGYGSSKVSRDDKYKEHGYSVRCVKD